MLRPPVYESYLRDKRKMRTVDEAGLQQRAEAFAKVGGRNSVLVCWGWGHCRGGGGTKGRPLQVSKLLGWLLENLESWVSTQGQTKRWGYSCLHATVDRCSANTDTSISRRQLTSTGPVVIIIRPQFPCSDRVSYCLLPLGAGSSSAAGPALG
jgi:hypothetical protein